MTTTELAIFGVSNPDTQIVVQVDTKMVEALKNTVEKYRGLEIKGLDDKEGLKAVHDARMELARLRIKVQKDGKLARDWHTKYNKAVIEEENNIISLIEPVESDLKQKEDAIENEKKRIKEEKERQEQMKMQERFDALSKFGATTVNLIDLGKMSDELFNEILESAKSAFEKEEEEKRIAEEAQRKAQEEADKLAAEEQVRKDAELEKLRKQNEELEAKQKAAEEAQQKAQQELAAKEKAIEDEKRKAADALQKQQDLQRAAEQSRIETEARIKREQEEAKQKEEERVAALHKQKKMKEFLEKNGYSEETAHLFHIQTFQGKTTLYKKVDEITI